MATNQKNKQKSQEVTSGWNIISFKKEGSFETCYNIDEL